MNAPKQVLVLGSVALGGAALIGWGWIRRGTHDYLPGLLANLGTALLLGVLFIVLQQIITRRIDDVRTNTRDLQTGLGQVQRDLARTSERLDELTGATRSRNQSAHAELADEIRGLATDVSFRRVFGLLSRGEDLQVPRRGVRVRLPLPTTAYAGRTGTSSPAASRRANQSSNSSWRIALVHR